MVQQRINKPSFRSSITQAKPSQLAPRQLPAEGQGDAGGVPSRPDKNFWVQRLASRSRLGHHFARTSPGGPSSLPHALKSGIESLSGVSMDGVKVHYNSPQPAQLDALAYTRGSEIHVAPGQERHLPHEAWHVVQQAQGRVQPKIQLKDGVPANDDGGLEREADEMGAKALASASQLESEPEKPGLMQRRDTEGRPAQRLHDARTGAGSDGVVQRVLNVNGKPLSKAFFLGHKDELQGSEPIQKALHQAGVEVPDWDDMIVELAKLAESTTVFNYTRTSEAIIEILEAGGADALIAARKAAGAPEAAEEGSSEEEEPMIVALPSPDYSKDREKKLKAKEAKAKPKQPAPAPPKQKESPYKSKVKTYDKALEGAIVLVEGNYVVLMEHYQLKHNPDIDVLYAGGAFKGKKGSTLDGGWDKHAKTYAKAVLAHVKPLLPAGEPPDNFNLTLKKVRLADLDAYIGVTEKDGDWIISYHGNPPE